MKKHSTGALTNEKKQEQDQQYAKNHSYDYLILGSGLSALSVGSLLAHAGNKVCMLEAHDVPGGMGHTFKMGEFSFCAQIHYVWGCAPGERVYEFLKKIGLEKDITFERFDPDGYDRMVMPDGKAVFIPYGFVKLAEHIDTAYPGHGANVHKFLHILSNIRREANSFPNRPIKWWEYPLRAFSFRNLIKYRNSTLQDVFDECEVSKEAQAILIANAGNFMAPPNQLSIFGYSGLFCGYNCGAYYPTKHFGYVTNRLAKFITDHDGCHIYYETKVSNIIASGDSIGCVETADGKSFTAKTIICNMDPQQTSHLIGRDKFSKKWIKPLSYTYSPSAMIIYLGLKGIDLKKLGFGKFNTWHLEQWDMNQMWKEQGDLNFDNPWVFLSTPSLHTDDHSTTPNGGAILEIESYTEYQPLKDLQDQEYRLYNKKKAEIAERLIDLVEKKYVPNLRKHIVVKTIGTPVTHADFCLAPKGNAYGQYVNPAQIGLGRLKAKTPFKNFWWCNASSGFGGFHGTIGTGTDLYMDLTNDRFWNGFPPDKNLLEK